MSIFLYFFLKNIKIIRIIILDSKPGHSTIDYNRFIYGVGAINVAAHAL